MNEFKSQICTSIEQSKRLLELGLNPETADCFHWNYSGVYYVGNITEKIEPDDIPAWSLHRLIILCNVTAMFTRDVLETAYDDQINAIENLINNEVFNKEYLKNESKNL